MSIIVKIFYFFEALSFIAGLFYWRKVKDTYFKWFVLYLLYIFVADVFGTLLSLKHLHTEKYYDYFAIPVEFLFTFWLFYKTFQYTNNKRLPAICAGIYLSGFVTDVIYFSKMLLPFYSFSYTVGNLLLLILILSFFIKLVNSDEVLDYKKNMMFWICTGLLIFYLGTLPYYGMKNTFAYKYKKLREIYNIIVLVLDSIMYLMFTFSFIWGKPNSRSSQS